jgi:hypothetical protein
MDSNGGQGSLLQVVLGVDGTVVLNIPSNVGNKCIYFCII